MFVDRVIQSRLTADGVIQEKKKQSDPFMEHTLKKRKKEIQ